MDIMVYAFPCHSSMGTVNLEWGKGNPARNRAGVDVNADSCRLNHGRFHESN